MKKRTITIFMLALLLIALAGGLSSSIFSNYFNDVFHVTSAQRGFIEVPRESPGVLCALLVGLLGGLGTVKMSVIAQLFAVAGIAVMGYLNPTYGVMLACLFIHSLGEHLFMPLNDSLSMSLSEKGKEGSSLGKYKSISMIGSMAAAVIVFFGFRLGLFSFTGNGIQPFAIAAILYLLGGICLMMLVKEVHNPHDSTKKFVYRKEYIPYYLVTLAYGCQKRIKIVFAPWVVITLLHQGADTVALLSIILKFAAIWMSPLLGRLLDKYGPEKMLKVEAAYIIISFCFLGLMAGQIASGAMIIGTLSSILIYIGFILCSLFDQFGMVHSYAMRSIAVVPSDVTNTLSMGLSVDHVMAIIASPILGLIWEAFGVQYVFYIAAASSAIQIFTAKRFSIH